MSARAGVGKAPVQLPRYIYEPLTSDPSKPAQNKNLRLIHLKGASSETSELNCALEVVNVDETPPYEALSWCWGPEAHDQLVTISTTGPNNKELRWAFYVPNTLAKGLRVLRREKRSRTLWVDFICINQHDKTERNKQVPMMPKIYGNAKKVCIWLDDTDLLDENMPTPATLVRRGNQRPVNSDSDSDNSSDAEKTRRDLDMYNEMKAKRQADAIEQDQKAIRFIQYEVLRLWNFDELCKNKRKAGDWVALLSLMRKPWFSRRWVVQEIALAKKATLYTAEKKVQISWRDFVDAVSLFVEVEDASHRLTEIMEQDEVYHYIPDFFEDLSEIGASMLVKATSNLFRGDGKQDSQKSLENLVSSLAVFDVSDPRDAVYALLAISKDSNPRAANEQWNLKLLQRIAENSLDENLAKKTFRVDYSLKITDVFQEFVSFSIRRSMVADPERALDILCRPWAPYPRETKRWYENGEERIQTIEERLPSWILSPEQAAFSRVNHPRLGRRMRRSNADPLVGIPDEHRTYRAAESKRVNISVLKFKKFNTFYALFVEGFQLDTVGKIETASQNGHIPWDWIEAAQWEDPLNKTPPEEFWRTLVADRSSYGRNAPPFFERACHESIKRESLGETIDTKKLMVEGRCSIVAAFLRRVRAVIWNRRLGRCARMKRLCMTPLATRSGDMICILYGCSVPVVLRRHFKTDAELEDEIRCEERERYRPRENAARKIGEFYRSNKAERQRQAEETGIYPPPKSPEDSAKKAARWEKINQKVKEIVETEKAELEQKIQSAQAMPKDDLKRQYFEFIGACYVHGMMNGEGIEEQNNASEESHSSNQMKAQVFELH